MTFVIIIITHGTHRTLVLSSLWNVDKQTVEVAVGCANRAMIAKIIIYFALKISGFEWCCIART